MAAEWEETTVGDLVKRGVLERPLDGNHGSIHPKGDDFVSTGVPFISCQEAWGHSLQSWLPFWQPTAPNPREIWSVEKLAGHLENLKSVTGVTAALEPGHNAISWINAVHSLIVKAGCFELFRQCALIPNEHGDFIALAKLHRDGGIDTRLKEIAELLGLPICVGLIHSGINTKEVLAELNTLAEGTHCLIEN